MSFLFKIEEDVLPDIPGLAYIPDFISRETEASLIAEIDKQTWLSDLKRRVQHYGYRYDYKARSVTADSCLGALPVWLQPIANTLRESGVFPNIPDQVIVNEYEPGQGISAHIDCVPCFDNTIASLSLGSAAILQFTHPKTGTKEDLHLKERSLVVLSGAARYEWTHAIPARKSDVINGFKIERARRISLTFRNIILQR